MHWKAGFSWHHSDFTEETGKNTDKAYQRDFGLSIEIHLARAGFGLPDLLDKTAAWVKIAFRLD
jgi:hypothetical protein